MLVLNINILELTRTFFEDFPNFSILQVLLCEHAGGRYNLIIFEILKMRNTLMNIAGIFIWFSFFWFWGSVLVPATLLVETIYNVLFTYKIFGINILLVNKTLLNYKIKIRNWTESNIYRTHYRTIDISTHSFV